MPQVTIGAMDEEGSRVIHAICELAGLALSAWALDHMCDGALREAARPAWSWTLRRLRGVHEYLSMIGDAFDAGRGTVAIAERYMREDWRA